MQKSFSFMFDSQPTQPAIEAAVEQAKVALSEPASLAETASPEAGALGLDAVALPEPATADAAVAQYISVQGKTPLKFEDLDLTKTVIMERSKDGFKIVPLSRAAGTKMMLAERRFENGKAKISKMFSDAVLANINMKMDENHPMAGLLAQYGLTLVLSKPAVAGLRRIKREFNRMMVPFKFHVPIQFKDLQGKDDDFVTGPFVPDVYQSEINGYKKRLADLGLTDLNADFHLHPYQSDDVCQLACKHYAFLNHDMGLGKTLMAGALMQMHGYERILVVAPAAAIGSFQSGWRHELLRLGIPKDHIHVIEGPEDLPNDKLEPKRAESFRPFQDKPHVYLVDYTTLAKDKVGWANYQCPHCNNPVDEKMKGKCDMCHKVLETCPVCYGKACFKPDFDADSIKAAFNGRRCRACGWVLRKKVPTGGRVARANLIMGHILKRQAYGKTKHLTEEQHAAIDDISTYEKRQKVGTLASADILYKIDGYLSAKPVWKHIYSGMFKFLLMDESHMVKDNTTRRGNAIQMIKGLKRVYIMTGTMLTNYVSDSFWQLQRLFPGGLYPVGKQLLDFSAHKGMKKGEDLFLRKFEGKSKHQRNYNAGIIDPAVFWGLMARVQLRRHDDDVEVNGQAKLPEINFSTEFLEMDPYHSDVYRMRTGDFQRDIRKKIAAVKGQAYADKIAVEDLAPINPADLRSRLQDLRQIATCPDQTGIYQNKDGSVKMTTKDARILELVLEASAKNEKTVVFCTWVAQMERLKYFFEAQNVKTMCLGGGTSKWEKWESIDTWRSDPEHQVLLASIDSMGTAVNLTSLMPDEFKCRQVIFGSPEWAPNKMEQAWCRVYRIGQSEETHVHFLYHKGTIEEDMDEMLYQKRTTIAKAQDRVEITRDDTKVYHSYHEIATRIINKYQESGQ